MKKIFLSIIVLLLLLLFQTMSMAQDTNSLKKINVKEITSIKWDASSGLVYKQVPGANLGATSFAVIDSDRVAFLSDASSEIIITDIADGKSFLRFPVAFAPRDFVYDSGLFYILYESSVIVYNEKGDYINQFLYPAKYVGVERLARFSNATYLLLPSGNSLKIEQNNIAATSEVREGWITANGDFVFTKLNGDNTYTVKIISQNNSIIEKIFTADKKIAGVYVVGSTASKLVLDVQTWVSESPIAVERKIIIIEKSDGVIGAIISFIKVPDCYYVLSNKEIDLSANGEIYNMVTSPQGVSVFSLIETESENVSGYPSSLTSVKYHFNDHLLQLNEK